MGSQKNGSNDETIYHWYELKLKLKKKKDREQSRQSAYSKGREQFSKRQRSKKTP